MKDISRQIWDRKYRHKDTEGNPLDLTIEDTWRRVAKALAGAEAAEEREAYSQKFFDTMKDFKFLPAGRILAGAGTSKTVTLSNCFTMGTIPDSMSGIFDNLREAALTLQQGGGIGYDFSTIRPNGALVKGVAADASGPLPFMDVWDSMCKTVMSAGGRRGAMMATLRCDHPDVEKFVEAKSDPVRLRNFNLSVLVTDAFMQAVEADSEWPLVFGGKTYRTISARGLWNKIMKSTYDFAEPGVIFIDRVNREHNIGYLESIATTNPCGEKPMGPYASCILGSINLSRFVKQPFSKEAAVDYAGLRETTRTAVRMLDNVISVGKFPLLAQYMKAKADRQIGLGVTGLADMLAMCGIRYGSEAALSMAETVMEAICNEAYSASIDLAKVRGPFPTFDADGYLREGTFASKQLSAEIVREIRRHGTRNSLLLSVAPTGTISLLADNVSSGIEPIFALSYERRVRQDDDTFKVEQVEDYAVSYYREKFNGPLPDYFVTAQDLDPKDHVAMQAAVQKYVDSSISKTVNVPEDISFEDFKAVYLEAYRSGCKGCTTYRPNAVTGSILSVKTDKAPALAPESPTPRPVSLEGATHKLRWPGSPHALYVTINDLVEPDGTRRPFELFINSKSPEHYPWIVALTRMISAVFRRDRDSSFVVEELKAVFDPKGGAWVEGHYVPSLLAAVGGVIESHMRAIGYLDAPVDVAATSPTSCPNCGSSRVKIESGCVTCLDCGYSKCG